MPAGLPGAACRQGKARFGGGKTGLGRPISGTGRMVFDAPPGGPMLPAIPSVMPRPIHFEIQADDPARVIKFYETLFGWAFSKWDGPMPYWLVSTGPADQPGINGGLHPRLGARPVPDQAVIGFVCTVDVDSVDAYAAKAVKAGGSICVPKMAIPGVGWLAYAKDTEGNLVGMMESDSAAQ
jgi:predicted enzyme related to lactoylglutathione lyase